MATPGRIAATLGRIGTRAAAGYDWLLVRALCQRTVTLLLALLIAGLAVFSARGLQQELAPEEDRGVLTIMLSGPDGTGLSYIDRQLEQALKVLQPMVDEGLIRTVFTVTGRWDPNRAQIIAPLVDWSQRSESESQQALSARLRPLHNSLPGAQVRIWGGSGLGLRGGGGVSFAITGSDHRQIAQAADAFAAQIERELPHTRDVQVDFDATQPQLMLRIDRERAADLGVAVDGLELALSALVEGREVATLNVDDRSVPVMLESKAGAVRDPQDLLGLTVRSQGGAAVSLAQFVSFDNGAIAAQLDRLGQRRAVQMNLSLTEGYAMQQAVDDLRALAARSLPAGNGLLLQGDAASLEENNRGVQITFLIALVVVFLVLVAQFESITSAAVVILTVPFGLAAAAFAMVLGGVSINLYSQIGLLLLVGVMAKNGILMVEFADQLRDRGMAVIEAARQAAQTRLRAIVMTMASTVLAAVPLLISSGPGAESRASIGWVIFGGLALAAAFTLLLTPVIYSLLAPLAKPRADQSRRLLQELAAADEAGA